MNYKECIYTKKITQLTDQKGRAGMQGRMNPKREVGELVSLRVYKQDYQSLV